MYSDKLKIQLEKKLDRNNKPYYLGKLKFPGVVDFSKGVAMVVFTSEEGQEELQIGTLREPGQHGFETVDEELE